MNEGKIKGIFDFIFKRKDLENKWGGPFNGQEIRRKIVDDIFEKSGVSNIIETGSYLGDSTIYFAEKYKLPIYTCELIGRYYMFSKLRLRTFKNIELVQEDSRKYLNNLATRKNIDKEKVTFFYLDAHWQDDLPLKEELEIILNHWKKAVIMIDDFKVEGDSGYGFDNYGEGRQLSFKYIENKIKGSFVFFPVDSGNETGEKRGSVVLTNDKNVSEKILKSKWMELKT
jgi:predicted O-methyltransferase YrrM